MYRPDYEPKTSITGVVSNVGRNAATVINRAEVTSYQR